jgi:hypothetical protein
MLDSGVVSSFSTLEKEERLFELRVLRSIHQILTIKLTDKEYNQYVKKVVKISHKDEKRDGIQRD